ncbi:sensor histidine kinase [Patescibacteria group bacterium]
MNAFIKKITDAFFAFINKSVHFLYIIIEPRSNDEDSKRKEFILNILLFGSIILSGTAFFFTLLNSINLGSAYNGTNPIFLFNVLLFFLALYFLSRKGDISFASYVLVAIYFILATYTSYSWGIAIPQGILTYVLVIIISGILINTRFAFLLTLCASLTLVLFGYLQSSFLTSPDLSWKQEILGPKDGIVFATTFLIIALVSWLSNREIEKSLIRARRSEAELKVERDLLEDRVEERTHDLKKTQEEKAEQLYRFAEFGRMASGVFHDLASPITSVVLNIETLRKKYHGRIPEIDADLQKLENNITKTKKFTEAARRQIQNQDINLVFDLADEIELVLQMLSYRARKEGIQLKFLKPENSIQTYGNPIKFYHTITDLITNSIDAYEDEKTQDRTVIITLKQENNTIYVTVRDHGHGIDPENLDKIFEPLFTTKGVEKGTGIGLSTCKKIIEKDFGGSINIKSEKNTGAIFTVTIPVKRALPQI